MRITRPTVNPNIGFACALLQPPVCSLACRLLPAAAYCPLPAAPAAAPSGAAAPSRRARAGSARPNGVPAASGSSHGLPSATPTGRGSGVPLTKRVLSWGRGPTSSSEAPVLGVLFSSLALLYRVLRLIFGCIS